MSSFATHTFRSSDGPRIRDHVYTPRCSRRCTSWRVKSCHWTTYVVDVFPVATTPGSLLESDLGVLDRLDLRFCRHRPLCIVGVLLPSRIRPHSRTKDSKYCAGVLVGNTYSAVLTTSDHRSGRHPSSAHVSSFCCANS